ncbi:hypothetical protein KP509_10G026700 [Ceratopteris richardii]|uniref:non-specific serine/threonine protein kinase n=1 Tax=Ceratopteris richardii TaxID=49495 RepID=A0A8T2U359_CERRI|nr:hypothetical protein KP509_10G026700 [Ceratopteris richardii]
MRFPIQYLTPKRSFRTGKETTLAMISGRESSVALQLLAPAGRLLNYHLSGHMSPHLGNLESLQILDLMWNELSGSIPKELGNLRQLTLLLLSGNSLTGSIPKELGNLHLLDRFQIDSNQITGSIPSTFQNLVSIKHLYMNNNSLSGSIPKELGQLPKLVHLLAENNKIDGDLPPELANMSTLQILQLDNNRFSNASIPENYFSMQNIIKLSLRNCNLQGRIPDLSHMENLQYLDLSMNQLEGEMPSKLPIRLTTIDLSSNKLNGKIPEIIGRLPNLQLLSLKNNNFSGSIPPSFGTGKYFTSSNGEIILDLQNNSLSSVPTNLTNQIRYRPNLFVWVHANHEICSADDQLIHRICKLHHDDYFSERRQSDSGYEPSCDPETCSTGEEPVPATFYSQGLCRCAMAIVVGYRLKSPSFSFFTPFIKGYEEWIARGLLVSPDQVHLSSFSKELGPRFSTIVNIFPPVNGSRVFNKAELARIFSIFSWWKLPANDFYGPQELLSFNYALNQDDIPAFSSYKRSWKLILVIALSCVFGVIATITSVLLLLSRNHSRNMHPFQTTCWLNTLFATEKVQQKKQRLMNVRGVKEFRLDELAKATRNFSEASMVGQGGYGRVYRGELSDGRVVAIKRAKDGSRQGEDEFYTEIELLSRLHHRNLVALIGFCIDHNEQILVYEYMSNGTLKDRLIVDDGGSVLDFSSRLNIAIGAAKGIRYLHFEATPPIIHRDIKASNILLDCQENPRVADFGLSKLAPSPPNLDGNSMSAHVSTIVKGTPGYLDPEYFLTHQLTDKSDVYSFGVVLLEIISCMQPIANGKNIVREIKNAYNSRKIHEIVDAKMEECPKEALIPFVRLALACCDDNPSLRPSMNDVVRELESIKHYVLELISSTRFDGAIIPYSGSCKMDASSSSIDSTRIHSYCIENDAPNALTIEFSSEIDPR